LGEDVFRIKTLFLKWFYAPIYPGDMLTYNGFMMAQANKILVVDDELSLVQLCQLILEDAGYQVRGAVSGSQALAMVDAEMPDLILLDVMMPGMDGIEVCRRIRAQNAANQPCILMYTADDRDLTRDNSLKAGATAFITKDTPVFELASKIGSYLTV
jgi:DNA-binding response OmpR family regulator